MRSKKLTKRQTQALRTRLGRYAKSKCARYGCDACPFAVCVVEIQTDRIESNSCPIFTREVLPGDPVLESDYLNALPVEHPAKLNGLGKTGKRCGTCSVVFTPQSNRQRFCTKCADENEKKQALARQRRKRVNDAIKGTL